MEKYSVLMSLYMKEKPEYLRLALDSMIHQTVSPDEIVLVEDGPLTNELYTIVNEYIQKYPILVNTVVNEKNCGLGLALNCGLHVCRNDLVARMDTDDISKPDRCEKQLMRFDENPNLAIVGAWVDEFSDSPDQVISVRVVPTDYEDIYQFAKRRSSFNHPVVMYKKSVVFKHGGYADLKRNQDVDLFGRMLFAGEKANNINESLLYFRSNNDLEKRRKSWENTWSYIDTIKRFWKMGYSSFLDYALVAIVQTGMHCVPVKLQRLIYRKYLRNTKH